MSMKISIAAIGMAFAFWPVFGGEFNANGCGVKWDDRSVTVGNALFSKRCVCIGGRLKTTSFKGSSGSEWQTAKFRESDADHLTVAAEKSKWSPVGVEGVRVDISTAGVTNTLYVFSGMPGVISICPPRSAPAQAHDLDRDVYQIKEWGKALAVAASQTDHISYGQRHIKATSVICADQTDIRDQLL